MRRNPILDELGSYVIADLQSLARDMREAGERVIDFSIGDPREPTPPFIPAAMKAAVPEVSQYPTVAGIAVLRNAFAGYLRRRFGVEVDPATQVVPTSGSKEAIFTTPFAFVDPRGGEAVAFGTPGYPVYERGTCFAGAEAIGIPLQGDFVLRASDVPADAWERLRILWICSPHNPTGSVTGLDDLAGLVAACREHGVLLASDECYADLYDGEPPPSVLQVSGPDFAGTLAYFSLSKRSGMTGYRSGMIVGDAGAIAALKQLRASVGVAPAEYVQAAAAAAWSDDEHAKERREIFAAKRAVLRAPFEERGFEVVGSEAGIYLWVDIRGDEAAAARRLLEDGVVVSPGSAFGEGGEGFLRFALVPTLEECGEAAEVLRACLTEI
ncbi:MAG: aminotransferase class I/II-fold pyridoxal phosphate-dependent enzyme [Actinobacteria bacterium]|nr:aminotransferase class I/II-fold pyridoxal phosphate-dependent enzyme [Actinomycetota bacterium]